MLRFIPCSLSRSLSLLNLSLQLSRLPVSKILFLWKYSEIAKLAFMEQLHFLESTLVLLLPFSCPRHWLHVARPFDHFLLRCPFKISILTSSPQLALRFTHSANPMDSLDPSLGGLLDTRYLLASESSSLVWCLDWLWGRIKPRVCITAPWNLTIGDHCWLGEELWIDNLAKVIIGDHVCLSQGAYLCTGNHDFRSHQFDLRLGPITVQSEAWIAAHSVLGPGITVGAGAIVSLGAVALADVPATPLFKAIQLLLSVSAE